MQQSFEFNENPWSEDDDDKTLPVGTLGIWKYLFSLSEQRKPRKEISASSMSRCYLANWYQFHEYESDKLNPRANLTFIHGDVAEHVMKHAITKGCVGPDQLYSEVDFGQKTGTFTIQHREFDIFKQETLNIKFGKHTMTGHADGWGKRNSDGKWEGIEIKSASSFGFDKFKRGETPDYIKQTHALSISDKAKKLGIDGFRFFYINKNTSHVFDRFYPLDKSVIFKVIDEFAKAVGAEKPAKPFSPIDETFYKKKTGRKILPWTCGYCGYKAHCWPEAKRQITKGKPVWVIE